MTFIFLFAVGLIFRLWFATLVPQPFVYDQEEYYGYALGILKNGLHADIYRLYGYPLIIAPIIALFGTTSSIPWTIFHAVIDSLTGILVYLLAQKLFQNKTVAFVASLVYMLNPFTSGYVGVLLSEVVSIFLVTLIFLLIVYSKYYFLLFLLGFLPQVKPSFILFSALVALWVILKKSNLKKTIIGIFLFSLPFFYNVAGNIRYYNQFSFLNVEPTFAREFYASLFIGRGLPFTDTAWGSWPVEAQRAWGEFAVPQTPQGRAAVAAKHMNLAWKIIARDPVGFLRSRLAKMWYVWEKHFVFPYNVGRPLAEIKALTYWGNNVLLALGVIGVIRVIREKRKIKWFVGLAALFVFYISVVHAFSTSEERFSLPAYPLIILFAAYYCKQKLAELLERLQYKPAGGFSCIR